MIGKSRVIGVTGGIGVGKSAFCRTLVELGYSIVDADSLNRELLATEPVITEVQTAIPEVPLLNADSSLNKAALRACIVRDASARARLEAVMHPRIAAALAQRVSAFSVAAPGAWLFYEASLLFETKRDGDFDAIVVVDAPLNVRISRLMGMRGLNETMARGLIAAQMDQAEKVRLATVVAQNPCDSPQALLESVTGTLLELRSHFGKFTLTGI